MQELDILTAKNESFEAKSTLEIANIATARFEHQNTKFNELTQGCSTSTTILAKATEMKKYLLYSPRFPCTRMGTQKI